MIKGLTLLSTRIKQKVNSALLTERCVSCLAPTTDHGLCAACRGDLPANTPACPRCALPLPDSATGLCCGDCLRDPPPFARARIPWRYEFPVDRMIGRYKYQGQRKYGRPLMAGLARHLEEALARERAKQETTRSTRDEAVDQALKTIQQFSEDHEAAKNVGTHHLRL